MRKISRQLIYQILLGMVGGLLTYLILALSKYPTIEIGSAIGSIGSIIGLVMTGIGVFITIYSTHAIDEIDKRVIGEVDKAEKKLAENLKKEMFQLANSLIWYETAIRKSEFGEKPEIVEEYLRCSAGYSSLIPDITAPIAMYYINYGVNKVNENNIAPTLVIPKENTHLRNYLSRAIDILSEENYGGDLLNSKQSLHECEYTKALAYGLLGDEYACMTHLKIAAKYGSIENIINKHKSMLLYSFAGNELLSLDCLESICKFLNFSYPNSEEDINNAFLNEQNRAGQNSFVGLLKDKKHIPCNIYTNPDNDINSKVRVVNYSPMLFNTKPMPICKGEISKDITQVLNKHFVILDIVKIQDDLS